jgi:hypothetical protein
MYYLNISSFVNTIALEAMIWMGFVLILISLSMGVVVEWLEILDPGRNYARLVWEMEAEEQEEEAAYWAAFEEEFVNHFMWLCEEEKKIVETKNVNKGWEPINTEEEADFDELWYKNYNKSQSSKIALYMRRAA